MQNLDALIAFLSLVGEFVTRVGRAGSYGTKNIIFEEAVDETGASESGSDVA